MVYQTGPNLFLPKGHDCETWRFSGRNILVGDWTHGALRFDEVNILVMIVYAAKKKIMVIQWAFSKSTNCSDWCILRREFSGMIHWLTINFIIPATPSNPTHPATLRLARTHAPENVLIISRISGHSRGRTMADLMGIWWWDHPLEPSGMDPEIFSTFLPSKVAIVGHFLGRYTTWVIGESWTHWIGKPFSTNLYI